MKDYEDLLKDLYERRDNYLVAQKKKRKRMVKIAGAGSTFVAACVAGIFIWHKNQSVVTQTIPATESTEMISVAENKTEDDFDKSTVTESNDGQKEEKLPINDIGDENTVTPTLTETEDPVIPEKEQTEDDKKQNEGTTPVVTKTPVSDEKAQSDSPKKKDEKLNEKEPEKYTEPMITKFPNSQDNYVLNEGDWVKGNTVIQGDVGIDGFFCVKDNVSVDDSLYELLQNPKDDNAEYYVSVSVEPDLYDLFVYEGKTYNEYYNNPALKAYRDGYEEWYEIEYRELEKQKLKELSEYEMAVWEKNNTPETLFPEIWESRHSAEEIEKYNRASESERKAFSEYCSWLDSDTYRQALADKGREIFTELVKCGIESHFLETLQGVSAKGNLTVRQMLNFPIENIKNCKVRIRALSE